MKIALLYSGISNFTQDIIDNHRTFIYNLYDCDIYLSTWDLPDIDVVNQQIQLLQPIKYEIESFKEKEPFLNNMVSKIVYKTEGTRVLNVASMFYKIQQAFGLLETNQYDCVLRLRTDITFDSPLNIITDDKINIPSGGDHEGGFLDLFAYGSYNLMRSYCNLFDKLQTYIDNTAVIFHPESILRFYCIEQGLPINRFNYNIYLRGQWFNNT